ncbi:TIGR02281 family clan AA aspartic protease [Aquabacterium sp.]|uniref:retropepsin-like aspartic protease family protein n=1 Tax=Aquabacterium sp. TaxID=1872578 RepID=UPI0035AD8E89
MTRTYKTVGQVAMVGLSWLALSAFPVWAQSVAMTGSMGSKALLVVDGAAPKAVGAGEIHKGVKVISVSGDQAVIEVQGRKETIVLGGSPVSVGGGARGGTQIVLSAGPGGHYVASGNINGRSVQFMVDTGATYVAMGADEANRIGLQYQSGKRLRGGTANGLVTAYAVTLSSLRIQDVEVYNVEAMVLPQSMPFILLGNSFLSRFQMKQDNGTLTMSRRF